MKVLILFPVLLFQYAFAQDRNSIWCFGDSAGIDFTIPTSPVTFASGMDGRGSCNSICDSTGQLLFYSFDRAASIPQSTLVMNRNHTVMDDGDSIVGEGWYHELIILPFPDSENFYYLFSIGITGYSPYGLYYSVIDLNLNGGLGKVVSKNIQLSNLAAFDGITAIKHGNGRDWWLIFKPDGNISLPNNDFYIYLVTPPGISFTTIQSVGNIITNNAGCLTFSENGDKLLMTNYRNLIQVFDFNRCTGILNNPLTIEPENMAQTGQHFASCFSPNGNLIYVTHTNDGSQATDSRLYQYDLTAPNIGASRDTLYHWVYPDIAGHFKRAPDNKIYLSVAYQCQGIYCYPYPDSVYNQTNMNLSVINDPDVVGSGCNFSPSSFYLGGKRTYYGLPNNPDYEMGPLIGSGCDSLVGVKSQEFGVRSAELHVFYHPGWQVAFVNAEGLKGKNYSLHVYDLTGREVFKESGKLNGAYYTKDLRCEGFANGLYVVNLRTEKEVLSKKFIKQ